LVKYERLRDDVGRSEDSVWDDDGEVVPDRESELDANSLDFDLVDVRENETDLDVLAGSFEMEADLVAEGCSFDEESVDVCEFEWDDVPLWLLVDDCVSDIAWLFDGRDFVTVWMDVWVGLLTVDATAVGDGECVAVGSRVGVFLVPDALDCDDMDTEAVGRNDGVATSVALACVLDGDLDFAADGVGILRSDIDTDGLSDVVCVGESVADDVRISDFVNDGVTSPESDKDVLELAVLLPVELTDCTWLSDALERDADNVKDFVDDASSRDVVRDVVHDDDSLLLLDSVGKEERLNDVEVDVSSVALRDAEDDIDVDEVVLRSDESDGVTDDVAELVELLLSENDLLLERGNEGLWEALPFHFVFVPISIEWERLEDRTDEVERDNEGDVDRVMDAASHTQPSRSWVKDTWAHCPIAPIKLFGPCSTSAG
jgi:hypothetical protein